MLQNIIRIQVKPWVRQYFKSISNSKNGIPYIELDRNYFFDTSIVNFLTSNVERYQNFIPKSDYTITLVMRASHVEDKEKGKTLVSGSYGLTEKKGKKLGTIMGQFAYEALMNEVLFLKRLPGISVTESIITVLGKYDIQDYRVDSFRKAFDRWEFRYQGNSEHDKFVLDQKFNESIKKLYDKKFIEFLNKEG